MGVIVGHGRPTVAGKSSAGVGKELNGMSGGWIRAVPRAGEWIGPER